MSGPALAWGAGLALLALLVAGCGDDGDDSTSSTAEGSVDEGSALGIESAASVPSDVDVRLTRRIMDPLPDDVVVRFQQFNRGPDPRGNQWWELTAGGDVYLARHSSDTSDPDTPFDTPRPSAATARLGADAVEEVTAALTAAAFAGQPAYQLQPDVEDGTFSVVTARLPDGAVHEVVYDGVRRPPLDTLEALTERIEEAS